MQLGRLVSNLALCLSDVFSALSSPGYLIKTTGLCEFGGQCSRCKNTERVAILPYTMPSWLLDCTCHYWTWLTSNLGQIDAIVHGNSLNSFRRAAATVHSTWKWNARLPKYSGPRSSRYGSQPERTEQEQRCHRLVACEIWWTSQTARWTDQSACFPINSWFCSASASPQCK